MYFHVTNGDEEASYDSNTKWSNGVSASYKDFGFSISKSWGHNKSTEKYGKTKSTDYQFYIFKKHFGIELYYQKMKGFFMDNPGDYDYSAGDTDTIRPDIKTRHIGTNVYYSFSDNFSLANVYDCKDPIEKSSGSFLLYMGLDITKISSDSGLIPDKAKDDFEFAAEVKTVNAVNFYAGVGYTHAFVYKGFFAAASFILAGGPSFVKYDASDKKDGNENIHQVYHCNMKYTLGYNGDSFMSGIYAFWHSSTYGKKKCMIQIDGGKFGFFAGTRF